MVKQDTYLLAFADHVIALADLLYTFDGIGQGGIIQYLRYRVTDVKHDEA